MRYLFFFILVLPSCLLAQTDTSGIQRLRPPRTIKTNPLEWINPFSQSFTVQTDWPIARRWGLELGAGAVLTSQALISFEGETYRGLRLRSGIKYYFHQEQSWNFYMGMALKGSWVQSNRYIVISRQGGQYLETIKYQRQINMLGAALYIGKRFLLEPFVGLGVRQQYVSGYDLPPDAVLFNNRRDFITWQRAPGTYILPDVLLGFYFGWRI
jgi:hypothetical protein